MEIVSLIADIVLLLSLLASSIYGIYRFFRKKAVLFMQIITSAVICLTLGQLFTIVHHLTSVEKLTGANVGILGVVGGFFFLFSASFGQIDGLGDNRDKSLTKYRLIPLAMPLCFVVCYIFICISGLSLAEKIVSGFVVLVVSLTSYYNLKHLILPDVECGILDALKKYNILIIILTAITIIKLFMPVLGWDNFNFIFTFILAGLYAFLIPVANRGVKKWFL